jgi:hypothetical protein
MKYAVVRSGERPFVDHDIVDDMHAVHIKCKSQDLI